MSTARWLDRVRTCMLRGMKEVYILCRYIISVTVHTHAPHFIEHDAQCFEEKKERK